MTSSKKGFYFPDDVWRIIKEYAEITGNIKCNCDYYLHSSKNIDGFAMYDYNTNKIIWCCKKYYESLYKELYDKHSIWKYIVKEKDNSFQSRFNYFNKNKKILLKYIMLEKENPDCFFGRRKRLDKLLLDMDKRK
jgi:hypothetical protein